MNTNNTYNTKTLIEGTPEDFVAILLSAIKPILKELQEKVDRPEPYIGVPEVARILRVSQGNIRKKCAEKTIPHSQEHKKAPIRFKASEIHKWVDSGRVETNKN